LGFLWPDALLSLGRLEGIYRVMHQVEHDLLERQRRDMDFEFLGKIHLDLHSRL
jgi:hypothetical protein